MRVYLYPLLFVKLNLNNKRLLYRGFKNIHIRLIFNLTKILLGKACKGVIDVKIF